MRPPFRSGTLRASIPVPRIGRRVTPKPWPGRIRQDDRVPVSAVLVHLKIDGVERVQRSLLDAHIQLRVTVEVMRYRRAHPDAPPHHIIAARAAARVAAAYDIAVARLDTLEQRFAAQPTLEETWNARRSLDTSMMSRSGATARRLWQRLRRRATTDA